jgi:hypothetical protein
MKEPVYVAMEYARPEDARAWMATQAKKVATLLLRVDEFADFCRSRWPDERWPEFAEAILPLYKGLHPMGTAAVLLERIINMLGADKAEVLMPGDGYLRFDREKNSGIAVRFPKAEPGDASP